MFIIRAKQRDADHPGWVVIKTPLGPLPLAFAAEEDARAYLRATGADFICEAPSCDDLLQREPGALEGVLQLLLIPSLGVTRALLGSPSAFPYDRYVVAMPSSA
jgi:hypothetical protein